MGLHIMKAFVDGWKFYCGNGDCALEVTAESLQNKDPEVPNVTYDAVTLFQERVPCVNMIRNRVYSKSSRLPDPCATNFDPVSVFYSSFIRELEKTGFIDAVWKKEVWNEHR